MNPEPNFSAPRRHTVTLTRDFWVAGRGLPAGGVCLGRAGAELMVATDNGADWYADLWAGRKAVRVAVVPSAL